MRKRPPLMSFYVSFHQGTGVVSGPWPWPWTNPISRDGKVNHIIYIYGVCSEKTITGWWFQPTPLKNDGVKVSWDDDIHSMWKVIKFMFQTTNQIIQEAPFGLF